MTLTIPSRQTVVDLLSSLVAIESVNPSLVPGARGEAAIAAWVAEWCQAHGLDTHLQEAAPGRSNVIARLPGQGGGRSLLLNAHLDTVGLGGMEHPLTPRIEGDRLYGRGAYDMKAGLAAIMLAADLVRQVGAPAGDLILTAVVDEEYTSAGTERVLEDVRTDGAIVTEPTGLRLCVAHKGFAWLTIETVGRAAHGSKRDLGIDAITRMGRVLGLLEDMERRLAKHEGHPLLGSGSVHASLIEGGQELSSYPERCRLQVERRTTPGETPEMVVAEIELLLASLRTEDPTFTATSELTVWREPFEVAMTEPIVQAVRDAAHSVMAAGPEVYGDTPWMDAALFSAAGIPTVVFGPGGAGAHAAVEYASVSEVGICAQILARAALQFCSA